MMFKGFHIVFHAELYGKSILTLFNMLLGVIIYNTLYL